MSSRHLLVVIIAQRGMIVKSAEPNPHGPHPITNVGDDAHIVPKSYRTTRYVEWDGVTG